MIQSRPSEQWSDDPTAAVPGSEPRDRLKGHAEEVKRQAGEIRQAAGEAASHAGESLREASRQAKDQVMQTARQTTAQVQERASDVLASQKKRLADEVSVFAEALHNAADTLDQHDDRMMGRYVHQAADCVDGCVNYLRERDASEMVRRVGEFTRRHPEVVLGGLFLAGVAAARFLKASDRDRVRRFDQSGDYGRDYGYLDQGRGLESEDVYGYGNPTGTAYPDRGYGDIGMYAGEDASGAGSRGMNEPFGATGGATLDRSISGDADLDDIARRDDIETIGDVSGLDEADIPDVGSPQPGGYSSPLAGKTSFESGSGRAASTNPTSAADGLTTIGRNDPSINTTNPR